MRSYSELLGMEEVFPLPPINEVIDTVLAAARVTNPACVCAGISVNTSSMSDVERRDYLAGLGEQSGLPCVDPVATGMAPVADFLQEKC
jgi:uncharacterized NAD-dependent epimerase/dehydratase family protein